VAQPEYPVCGGYWAREMLARMKAGTLRRSVRAEVQALRLGDAATLVALPGEAFVEIGLRIKRELTPRYPGLCLVGYANGYAGYLPSRRIRGYSGRVHRGRRGGAGGGGAQRPRRGVGRVGPGTRAAHLVIGEQPRTEACRWVGPRR